MKKLLLIWFLKARDEEKGKRALAKLKKEAGLYPKFYKLDVTNYDQVDEFAKFIENKYGGVDILVNNAAVLYKVSNI